MDHVSVRIPNEVEDSLGKELSSLPDLSSECSIYKVPSRLRFLDVKSYVPRLLSIGPLHHGKKSFKEMEEYKKRYLKRFLQRTNTSLKYYINIVKDQETRLRNYYADPIRFDGEKFATIILVDAAFVIEILLRFNFENFRDDTDRFYNKPRLFEDIFRDMILLENQLPFFILEELYNQAKKAGLDVGFDITVLSQRFLKECLMGGNACEGIKPCKVEHFLDLQRNFSLPSTELKGRELKFLTAPNVTQLHRAGVKFKLSETEKNLFEVSFDKGIMKIPKLKITDDTKTLIRNIIAFEQCHYDEKYFTDYFGLMSYLIKTPKDVEILVEAGIIEHSVSDNNKVSTIIKDLNKELTINFDKFYYVDIFEKTNMHCKNSWHIWKANLTQNYFNTPWAVISIIAASVVIVLTFIQSVCSLLSL